MVVLPVRIPNGMVVDSDQEQRLAVTIAVKDSLFVMVVMILSANHNRMISIL